MKSSWKSYTGNFSGVFTIPIKYENYFISTSSEKLSVVLLQITNYIYAP